jgi:dTDP-4-dehydrorhamnose reductase
MHLTAAGEMSRHGFASAIVEGLKARGTPLKVRSVVPIRSQDYPTKAKRPANSRLDLARLQRVFGIVTPPWQDRLPSNSMRSPLSLRRSLVGGA